MILTIRRFQCYKEVGNLIGDRNRDNQQFENGDERSRENIFNRLQEQEEKEFICQDDIEVDMEENMQNTFQDLACLDDVLSMKDMEFECQKVAETSEHLYGERKRKTSPYDVALDLMELNEFVIIDEQLYLYCKNEGYWRLIPESEANRAIRNILPDCYCRIVNKSFLYEVYEWLRNSAEKIVDPVEEKRFVLNFRDTAFNWKKGRKIKKRKKLFFRYCLQIEYNSIMVEGEGFYRNFVNGLFGRDEETKKEFRKFLAMCVSDIRDKKLSFFLYGPSNTGKSVILNVLRMIIGDEWSSSVSFTQMSSEFALTQLLGKRINLSGEVSGTSNKRLDIFKTLTGNDYITACYKGKDHFQFKNEALLVFACNAFPPLQNVLDGSSFLARVRFFPFQYVVPESEWIDDLARKIFNDSEELLDDILRGLHELEEDDFSINESPIMMKCKKQFVASYNSFELFAEECLIADVDSRISSREIRNAYKSYCHELDLVCLPDVQWSQLLLQMFPCTQTTITMRDLCDEGKRARGYKGVHLVSEADLKEIKVRNL